MVVPNDFFFYLGDDNFHADYSSYQRYYNESGKLKPYGKKIVLVAGNLNTQNSNEEHFAGLINRLESAGMNVYPINSFGFQKLTMIQEVDPGLIIIYPHGRMVMGGGDAASALLEKLNVPVLAPLAVNELYDNWLDNPQGMASGGMSSMNVVMPELDGAVAPFAFFHSPCLQKVRM